jgi:hypothetical protein
MFSSYPQITQISFKAEDTFFWKFHLFSAHASSGQFYSLVDFNISGATTQVAGPTLPESQRAMGSAISSTIPQHQQKTRRTVTTLRRAEVRECLL